MLIRFKLIYLAFLLKTDIISNVDYLRVSVEMIDFIDIHCHILPGLDDGSRDLKQTEEMLKTAYDEGIRKMIATPHNYANHRSASPEKIMEAVSKVNHLAKEKNIGIEVFPGNEIFYRQGVCELLEEGKILTMAGSQYVLVEFYPDTDWHYLRSGVQELQQYGYTVILAHSERYECLYEKDTRMKELVNSGVCIQVNASSFNCSFGDPWRKRSRSLLKKGMISFIGTDAHNNESRAPKMQACAKFLYKRAGSETSERLLYLNAEKELIQKED